MIFFVRTSNIFYVSTISQQNHSFCKFMPFNKLREGHRLKWLMRISVRKTEEVTGRWIKLIN